MSDSSKDISGLFPINRVDNNIHYTAQEYGLSPSGYFGEKGKKVLQTGFDRYALRIQKQKLEGSMTY